MNELSFDLVIAVASFFAGVLGSLIGLGGGILITPILVLALGIDIRYAMGAALSSVIATSSGAAVAYLKDGISNMRIGMFLCIATTIGAVSGAFLAMILDPKALSMVFGAALLLTVILSFRKKVETIPPDATGDPLAVKLRLNGEMPTENGMVKYPVFGVIPGFAMMFVAGILSGLLGIGSGAFKVVAMDQVMKIPFKVTTATSNFMIGVTAAASIGIYLKKGYIDPVLVFPVALGVLVGAFVGARLLPVVPVNILRIVFLAAVFLIGVQMILKGFGINV